MSIFRSTIRIYEPLPSHFGKQDPLAATLPPSTPISIAEITSGSIVRRGGRSASTHPSFIAWTSLTPSACRSQHPRWGMIWGRWILSLQADPSTMILLCFQHHSNSWPFRMTQWLFAWFLRICVWSSNRFVWTHHQFASWWVCTHHPAPSCSSWSRCPRAWSYRALPPRSWCSIHYLWICSGLSSC